MKVPSFLCDSAVTVSVPAADAGGGGPNARTPLVRSSKFRSSSRVKTLDELRTLASQTKFAKALTDIL